MAKTISELEKERAELLKKIEQEARQAKHSQASASASQSATTSEGSEDISLNDFLRAAQEVIPDEVTETPISSSLSGQTHSAQPSTSSQSERVARKMAKKTSSSQNDSSIAAPMAPRKKTNTLFSIFIIATLSLTFLGVLGLVYVTLKEQLDQLTTQFQETQVTINSVQKQLSSTGKGESFEALKSQVAHLQAELEALKQQVTQLKTQPAVSTETPKVSTDTQGNIVLTPEAYNQLLDQKLATYTHRLEQKLDHKINLILKLLQERVENKQTPSTIPPAAAKKAPTEKKESKPYQLPQAVQEPAIKEPDLQQPIEPKLTHTANPVNPKVASVATSKPPVAPVAQAPKTPMVNTAQASHWLQSQPMLNYTLQLASMTNKQAVEKIKQAHQLTEAKIIPQKRAGEQRYVLVLGSYPNRNKANEVAREIKSKTGIAPWIRRIKDIAKYARQEI